MEIGCHKKEWLERTKRFVSIVEQEKLRQKLISSWAVQNTHKLEKSSSSNSPRKYSWPSQKTVELAGEYITACHRIQHIRMSDTFFCLFCFCFFISFKYFIIIYCVYSIFHMRLFALASCLIQNATTTVITIQVWLIINNNYNESWLWIFVTVGQCQNKIHDTSCVHYVTLENTC